MTDRIRTNTVAVFAVVTSTSVAAYGAYNVVGWIGIGVLGLLIAFIAIQTDMDNVAPIGGQHNTNLYAASLQTQQAMSRAEKAEHFAKNRATVKALHVAKLIGAVLALVGLLGFFLVQLPR